MVIVLIVLGSRGDVQPLIALASGLRQRGHIVRVATHESLRQFVERHGFEFRLVRPDLGGMLQLPRVRQSMERGNLNMIVNFLAIMRELRPELDTMAEEMLDACRGADAVIYPKVYGAAGHYIASWLGLLAVAYALQPCDPTGDFATLALPPGVNLGRWANWRSHQVAINALGWQPYAASARSMARRHFPGEHIPARGPFAEMRRTHVPTLCAFSEHVVPKPSDWDAWLHVTGYWWLDEPAWSAPAELTRFLDDGEPPVYVGFGSMPAGSARITAMVLGALRASGQRGVLAGRWDGLPAGAIGSDVIVVNDVPHSWLLPRMSAVVHHSGAGTTAAALRAGVPSINVPFFIDQPFWADRVRALGVGPNPIPLRKLNEARLTSAISRAVTDQSMRERCLAMRARLAEENGVEAAVEVIETALATRGATWSAR